MKSIAAQICEAQDALIAKGVTMDAIKEAVKDAVNEEHRLSIVLDLKKKHLTESSRPARTKKNNGSVMSESKASTEERILEVSKNFRMSMREATVYVTGSDPGTDKISESAITELASRWKKYCGLLTAKECRQLAEKGISPR